MLIRALAAGLVAFPFLLSPVHAADPNGLGPLRGSLAPVKRAQTSGQWTGFHVGAMAGYEWLDLLGEDIDGLAAGFYGGVDYQIGQFVLGAETDFLFTSPKDFDGIASFEQEWAGSLRARAGVAIENYLFYATGGLAYSRAEVAVPLFGVKDSRTHLGWTVGGGVEAQLAKNLSARLEYRYADYGSEKYVLYFPSLDGVAEGELDFATHSLMAGIGYRF